METYEQTQPHNATSAQHQYALNTLFNPHPIAQKSKETRSQYLSLLALGMVMTEPITGAQCLAFHHLAASLGLDESEANEYCDGKRTIKQQDYLDHFQELSDHCMDWFYRLDLAWLQTVDGLPSLKAQLNMQRICDKLGEDMKVRTYNHLHHFALLVRAQDKHAIIREMERMIFLVPSPLHLEQTALAVGMQRMEIKVALPEENREQNLSIVWMHNFGQALQAGETVAALVNADDSMQTAGDVGDSLPLQVQVPCMGIMEFNDAINGAVVQHGLSVGTFYGFPSANI